MLVLLFASGLLPPPFQAARSAQLPQILTGERHPLGLVLNLGAWQEQRHHRTGRP
ncbi:hypothetical protein [Actinomadura sp. HBU206391]|uniref:hypothetical protein n=1 Tax=Actinomadura sp. HBU206391 TaxID=2731692 RepID=UPI00164F2721|nr:hypothetical protein [Actinomadura sp. HBU206391]MBC6460276.1 hypothetical protein [Actinomadura sp. HBU206391]